MRDNLGIYRGVHVHTKEWMTGYYYKFSFDGTSSTHYIAPFPCHFQSEVYQDTVTEYTGVKDKNGKMIFEGDVVECTFKNSNNLPTETMEVVFYYGSFKIKEEGEHEADTVYYDLTNNDKVEVTGNIYGIPYIEGAVKEKLTDM